MKTREDIPSALAVSEAGRVLIAAGSSYSLTFWDLDSGALTQVMYAPTDSEKSRSDSPR